MSFIELVAQRRSPTPPPGMQAPENAKDWFRIDNSAAEESDETDVYVYDSIGGWFGMYSDEFIDALKGVSTSKINLRLNSPGGSVFEGIAIANAIRNHPATVTVYVDSLAASIASVIALAGDRVVMMPQSQFMVHNASGACYGDATEMTKMADLLDKQSRNIAEAYAQHTGRPIAEWQQYMADETWFTAEEAVAVGLADEVMPMRPKKGEQAEEPAALMNRTWDLSMYQHAGRSVAPAPVINAVLTPFTPGGTIPAGKKLVDNVLRQFDEGDKVAALVKHEPEHTTGRIAVVNGNAYGVIWDNEDDDTQETGTRVYRWYTDDELQWLEGGEDHEAGEAEASEPTLETLKPGVSHPGGMPLPPHAELGDGSGALSNMSTEDLAAMIRDVVRDEIEAAKKKLPAFLQPDEDEDEDEESGDDDTDDESGADPEAHAGETPASIPAGDGAPPSEHPVDTGLGNAGSTVEHTETYDENDDWLSLVDRLTDSPSPSADDAFQSLKEAWL